MYPYIYKIPEQFRTCGQGKWDNFIFSIGDDVSYWVDNDDLYNFHIEPEAEDVCRDLSKLIFKGVEIDLDVISTVIRQRKLKDLK